MLKQLYIFSLAALLTAASLPASATDRERQRAVHSDGSLSHALLQRMRQLAKAPLHDDKRPTEAEGRTRVDPAAPGVAMARLQRRLGTMIEKHSDQHLRKAHDQLSRALATYRRGNPEGVRATHLPATAQYLTRAQAALNRTSGEAVGPIQAGIAEVAQTLAAGHLGVLRRAGVTHDRLASVEAQFDRARGLMWSGNPRGATAGFGYALDEGADAVRFDVETFEQNIIEAMTGEAVGFAFSIAYLGANYNGGYAAGLARTAADGPVTLQSANKDMHVASVSKTITAMVVMRLLQEQGLDADEPVWPYLPGNWTLGANVDQLTFRHFLTHRSGFDQQPVSGASYTSLQALVAQDVVPVCVGNYDTLPQSCFSYDNDNFALMRIAAAGLMGIDPVDYAEFAADVLTAAAFLIEAESLYASIGISVSCESLDATPTIQYNFPDTGAPGFEEPPRTLTCGGIGWFINANELASLMTHFRQTQTLVDSATRTEMQDGFLGFSAPGDGYSYASGAFGTYYGHGGDWNHGAGELHACALAFPISVQASLLINSERGNIPYQCQVLADAFDNAWVP